MASSLLAFARFGASGDPSWDLAKNVKRKVDTGQRNSVTQCEMQVKPSGSLGFRQIHAAS
jgi:hypothetical protein